MPASPHLVITIHHCGRRSVVRLEGELDASTEPRLRTAIGGALDHSPERLVVDLSALGFMDCSGLSVLVWAHQRCAGQGRQLLITGAQPVVQRLIHLTGLDTYLQFSTPDWPLLAEGMAGPDAEVAERCAGPADSPSACQALGRWPS